MVVFYVILVVLLVIAVSLCVFKLITGFNDVYDEYRHVIETLVGIETNIDSIMKINTTQNELIYTISDYLKALSEQDSHIIESLTNIKSVIDSCYKDNNDKFTYLHSKQNDIFEALCDTISSNATIITESNKATLADFVATVAKSKSDKKTTKAKTAKA